MYDPIENGSIVEVQGLQCCIPPEGYVLNVLTKKLEQRDIYSRSENTEEQYWERIPLPHWYGDVMKKWDDFEKKNKDEDLSFLDKDLEIFKQQEWDRRLNGLRWLQVCYQLCGIHKQAVPAP